MIQCVDLVPCGNYCRFGVTTTGASMPEETKRATSFGAIADDYDRYRPGPTSEVLEWLLPADAQTVVDLGAGTGALTRLLMGRVAHVWSVEPDDRMREFLVEHIPGAIGLAGRGDDIPLEDEVADAVLVSSAWHWMEVEPTLAEVARVLRPGGTLGVVWSGPDRRVPWLRRWLGRARNASTGSVNIADALPDSAASADAAASAGANTEASAGASTESAPGASAAEHLERHRFSLPAGAPFSEPEHTTIEWSRLMTIDDLVGLAGTYSTMITLPDEQRDEILRAARTWLEADPELAAAGEHGIELAYRALCWRTTSTTRTTRTTRAT
jgi:SAM-dependent methyltransferase